MSADDAQTRPGDDELAPRGRLELVVFYREELEIYELPERGEIEIGRAESNHVRIEDASVSRRHARMNLDDRVTLTDLGGANGTFLREARHAAEVTKTQGLRKLCAQSAEIQVGDGLVFGTVSAVLRRAREPLDVSPSGGESEDQRGIVVLDPAMRMIHQQAERAAQASISVLLLGETGVGKEVLARAIHARSRRVAGPFMALNCAALSETLLEGELFGYERGAFTGATHARPGLFEAADGGSVFLDEVGELPLTTQVKLLRVLEERTVLRLGARSARAIDVRFISATNRDLAAGTGAGTFREDLFYRLNGLTLTIPPLRERPGEIVELAKRFVRDACLQLERTQPLAIDPAVTAALKAYAFPGNVRELRNVIERAVVLCSGDTILLEHLPAVVVQGARPIPGPSAQASHRALDARAPAPVSLDSFEAEVRALERARIVEALTRAAGNQTKAAQLLGISRRTLVTKLGELELPRPRKPRPDDDG